jgi:hypothetical protein
LIPGVSNAHWFSQVNVAFRKFEEPRIIACPGIFRKYPVVYGQANLVAEIMKEIYKGTRIRVSTVGEKAILVYGAADDQKRIAEEIIPYQVGGK